MFLSTLKRHLVHLDTALPTRGWHYHLVFIGQPPVRAKIEPGKSRSLLELLQGPGLGQQLPGGVFRKAEVNEHVGVREKVGFVETLHRNPGTDVIVPIEQSLSLAWKGTEELFQGVSENVSQSQRVRRERERGESCLLYTSPSPRDLFISRMPSSA